MRKKISAKILVHVVYEECLKRNGIFEYFDSFTHADEVLRRKGYPDIYELSAGRMNVDRDKCIVFEDVVAAVKLPEPAPRPLRNAG